MMASSCRADSRPQLIVGSGIDRVYVMSGGGTLDSVLVSTTMSGWEIPIVAEQRKKKNSSLKRGKFHKLLTALIVSCHIKNKNVDKLISDRMLTFSLVAYIWRVCTQHMCLHVPVPLSPLPRHPLPPLAAAGVSEAGNTKETSVM